MGKSGSTQLSDRSQQPGAVGRLVAALLSGCLLGFLAALAARFCTASPSGTHGGGCGSGGGQTAIVFQLGSRQCERCKLKSALIETVEGTAGIFISRQLLCYTTLMLSMYNIYTYTYVYMYICIIHCMPLCKLSALLFAQTRHNKGGQ
ncbi:unnamed protein product [Ceratitis capitata]|uniref:(Mediterranean fruit fly) hypothetical protein n=1 Tax=Ceratitis capitata TaxID=7213 RepID=A0A811U5B4_CERCA|nr:unnamed protein product [Ceratitis capitata]